MLKVLEALIAIMSILVAFVIVYRGVQTPDIETVNWRGYGFGALQTLDNNGLLAGYTATTDNTQLNASLAPLLPAGVNYDTVICNSTCQTPSVAAAKITSVQYYVAGNITNFSPRRVLLYMWS